MKRLYLLVVPALLLAACSPTETPTTVSVIVEPTSVSVANTQVPALDTVVPEQPTAVPATAIPAASPAESATVVPIVDPHNGFLLGGVRDGQWLAYDVAAPLLGGSETYRLYSQTAEVGEVSGSRPEEYGAPCEDVRQVTLSAGGRDDLVAVAATWEVLPRLPEDMDTNAPVYREAVAQLLRENGLAEPDVQITRIIRIDLDDDGVDEVLLSATYQANGDLMPGTEAGDYSLVALRTVVAGEVQTTIIEQDIYPEAAEFAAPTKFTLRGVADLNGDGRLEVLIDSSYYEGGALAIYDINGPAVTNVLGVGCGA